MFLACGFGGLGLSLILVVGPTYIFAAYTPAVIPFRWFWLAGAFGWVLLWLGLFVAAIREEAELKLWLADQ